ncbi:MAG: hypothetical protein ABSH53_07710 [Holophaga sp.]|jgi:hypothetical protein
MTDAATEEAAALLTGFAARTGLASPQPPRRYLWTDAFAVCTFLGLARRTNDPRWPDLARRTVEQVHHVLGRFRPDDARRGWLSGLDERDGEAHPTRGGLRIGKELPERSPDEPYDEDQEWYRDGQYFHYLTQWMHALDQMARWSGEGRFNAWARELAVRAHQAFTRGSTASGHRYMVWKMSTDLTRALVPSMGQHDPLEGWIACRRLQTTAARLGQPGPDPDLAAAASDYRDMVHSAGLATPDPLGIGGLLTGAARLAQLPGAPEGALVEELLDAALAGLRLFAQAGGARGPAERRLAFRELGLAIPLAGLDAVPALRQREPLRACLPLAAAIVSFWREPEHRRARSWTQHRDINEVMLAASLVPEGVLG